MISALAAVRFPEVLRAARLRNASDVHLSPGRPPVFRIDGTLEHSGGPCVTNEEITSLLEVLLDQSSRSMLDRSGDVTVMYGDRTIGTYRVHAYRASGLTNLAVRLLAASIPRLEELDLPAAVASLLDRNSGLVLVTGPTGSGKSTLLAALIDRINRTAARRIVTAEDPIEYVHLSDRSSISQRAIPHDVPDFSGAVYGALRADLDVLMIGELRDPATIHAALVAAETGHLVLATLHTGDATRSIDRIIGVFAPEAQSQVRAQLAETLAGIVCLRLIPRASRSGRIAAAEILLANEAVRSLVRESKTHQLRNIMVTGRMAGMQTLEMHLCDLVNCGEITYESAQAISDRPADLHAAQPVA